LVAGGEGNGWSIVDLARMPLQRWQGEDLVEPAEIERLLNRHLEHLKLAFFRLELLGMTSELGEGMDDFRRRALGQLRPEIQSLVDTAETDRKGELALNISSIANSIEEWRCTDPTSAVKRAEIGTLWVAEGVALQPPKFRSLMI
jgi:hypothetical protein